MKTALLAAALLAALAAPATAAPTGHRMNAGDLQGYCSASDGTWENTVCTMFVYGVVMGTNQADIWSRKNQADGRTGIDPPRTMICTPDDMPATQMVSVVRKVLAVELKRYPQDKNLPAEAVIFVAMQLTYPCGDGKAGRPSN
jgi:hypothetical protein